MKDLPDGSALTDAQEDLMRQYALLVKEFADKKITCFSEHVIPVEKVDISFICTD